MQIAYDDGFVRQLVAPSVATRQGQAVPEKSQGLQSAPADAVPSKVTAIAEIMSEGKADVVR